MIRVTQIVGVVLVVLGLTGYIVGDPHWTALLPAVLGAAILVAGVVAQLVDAHQHAIHAALVLALLGGLGSLRQLVALLGGDTGIAPVFGTITLVVCAVYIALGVRSFRAARKAREASGAG